MMKQICQKLNRDLADLRKSCFGTHFAFIFTYLPHLNHFEDYLRKPQT